MSYKIDISKLLNSVLIFFMMFSCLGVCDSTNLPSRGSSGFVCDYLKGKDTVTVGDKVDSIVKKFNEANFPLIQASNYELVDLNYDGNKDLVIHYYGLAGTGLKNRVAIYMYSSTKDNFFLDEKLSLLMNPSFYPSKKEITSFYVANGGGYGEILKWSGDRWDTLKYFLFTPFTINDEAKWEMKISSETGDTTLYVNQFVIPDTSLIPNIYK